MDLLVWILSTFLRSWISEVQNTGPTKFPSVWQNYLFHFYKCSVPVEGFECPHTMDKWGLQSSKVFLNIREKRF